METNQEKIWDQYMSLVDDVERFKSTIRNLAGNVQNDLNDSDFFDKDSIQKMLGWFRSDSVKRARKEIEELSKKLELCIINTDNFLESKLK